MTLSDDEKKKMEAYFEKCDSLNSANNFVNNTDIKTYAFQSFSARVTLNNGSTQHMPNALNKHIKKIVTKNMPRLIKYALCAMNEEKDIALKEVADIINSLQLELDIMDKVNIIGPAV